MLTSDLQSFHKSWISTVIIAYEIAVLLINEEVYVFGNKTYTSQGQIEQDKMKHQPFCNIYSP